MFPFKISWHRVNDCFIQLSSALNNLNFGERQQIAYEVADDESAEKLRSHCLRIKRVTFRALRSTCEGRRC
jgi:hypothetical protein